MNEIISAKNMDQRELCSVVRKNINSVIEIKSCCGQRYIGAGLSGVHLIIDGTPGNSLGAFLNGGTIRVNGNAQDAVGDTMNSGSITVAGSAGDALGYAMRGGKIFVKGDAGYRVGVNMKEYGNTSPLIVIGGTSGSFLGEYLAGGTIVVLGIGRKKGSPITGYFCGNGMYNGRIYLRTTESPIGLSKHLLKRKVSEEETEKVLAPIIEEFSSLFDEDARKLLSSEFICIEPNPTNRYSELYASM